MPGRQTFDSEIGDVHEGGRRLRTFDDEFEGLPGSQLRDDRPSTMIDRGRRLRAVLSITLILGLTALVAWVVWLWWEPISAWAGLASDQEQDQVADAQAGAGSEDGLEVEGADEGVDGDAGEVSALEGEAGEASATAAEPEDAPASASGSADAGEVTDAGSQPEAGADSQPASTPTPAAAKVEVASTSVRGRVSQASVESKLKSVDEALAGCWTTAVAGGASGPISLELRFTIKWNRRLKSTSVSGEGAPAAVTDCVRQALPGAGWPEPRDLGDATVTRTWTLSAG
ncbi:hypothetical protein G6O69_24825 [Pseudenhygromyxa sp. WMMC2535]|uniref:hypothetical protein n=1 Tax=Pseudenhygromyxa sp. WMMC2535 TaxID=2712867 RepID=UPI001553FD7E|nr:hypothetical protein [Pseudenhygromyxa sp. WMMC2535]NVB41087.1 hypothetical protein [Pseudenhygromyxa sp. WMMC2535]